MAKKQIMTWSEMIQNGLKLLRTINFILEMMKNAKK